MLRKSIFLLIIILLAMSPVSACSSIIGQDSFGFQRDSTEPANITIENINGTIIESKPGFVHSVVFNDGWAFGIGGADNKICNKIIVMIGCAAHSLGIPEIAYLAAPFTWYTGGHFALQSPSHAVFMTFVGGCNMGSEVLESGEYLVVSNDAKWTGLYRANDSFTAISQSGFAAGHHRYAIEYISGSIAIHNFQNESITID